MKKLMYLFLSVIMCCSVFSGCFGVLSGAAATDFTVAKIFGDNMVLQRGKEVNVFGTASEGTTVTVTFAGQTKTAVADSNGAWIAKLDAMQADSEGKTLTVSNGVTEKSFSGVLVGEVWFASGQSNMAYTVSQVGNQNQYTDFDNYPNIRLVKIPNDTSAEYTWENPSSVKDALNNSAMAQAFALQLQKELNVPVGIVTAAVGGSWIEQWMDSSTVADNTSDTFKSLSIATSTFFDSMVKPIIPFTFAGELWYQGEANCQEPARYENQFKAYVQMMRGYFGNIPILTMQLPRYEGTSTLNNATVVFLGSSVTLGTASGGYSMADYLKEVYGTNTVKWAVGGTTLVNNGSSSYVQRLEANKSSVQNVSHFICQLSTNDTQSQYVLGEISSSKEISDFDTSTIIGGIEYIIATAKKQWNCPVSFYTGAYFGNEKYETMIAALYDLQEKWGIGIIDLYNDVQFNAISTQLYQKYMADAVHPNELGYREWWGPEFAKYLNSVTGEGKFFPEFRLSQQNLHDENNKLYTVGGIDFGSKSNIHPKDKVEFAERAVNVALEFVYEQSVDSLSRLPVRIYEQGAETVVEYAQGTVLTLETVIDGFEISNNGEFKVVRARIAGNTVVLSGTGDKVRYLYSPYPEKLIFDERGYALAPFRMDIDKQEYTVSVECGEGGNVAEYSKTVKGGNSIYLVFMPDTGKQLVSVKVNGIERYVNGNAFELNNINCNINVQATFGKEENIFSVIATSNEGGSVFVDKSKVESGDGITVKVTEKSGYKVSKITVNGVKIKNAEEFTVSNITEDTTIIVEFAKSAKGCSSSLNTVSAFLSVVCVVIVALTLKKHCGVNDK